MTAGARLLRKAALSLEGVVFAMNSAEHVDPVRRVLPTRVLDAPLAGVRDHPCCFMLGTPLRRMPGKAVCRRNVALVDFTCLVFDVDHAEGFVGHTELACLLVGVIVDRSLVTSIMLTPSADNVDHTLQPVSCAVHSFRFAREVVDRSLSTPGVSTLSAHDVDHAGDYVSCTI